MRPRLAAVRRTVDAVAERRAVAWIAFARADPDDVLVRPGDLDVADRRDVFVVEELRKRHAAVRGLGEPARGASDIELLGLARDAGDHGDSAAGIARAHTAPAKAPQRGVFRRVGWHDPGTSRLRQHRDSDGTQAERRGEADQTMAPTIGRHLEILRRVILYPATVGVAGLRRDP
jgi:hypothetical protein